MRREWIGAQLNLPDLRRRGIHPTNEDHRGQDTGWRRQWIAHSGRRSGGAGESGGPNGDVYLIVKIGNDKRFYS